MTQVDYKCDFCGKVAQKIKAHYDYNLKIGHKNYCSRDCRVGSKIKGKTYQCKNCGTDVFRPPSKIKGEIFCSSSCNCSYHMRFRVGEKNPNFKHGHDGKYRRKALLHYGAICKLCGYDVESVLEVHHIDRNNKNHELENLVVLCPTHHREVEIGLKEL